MAKTSIRGGCNSSRQAHPRSRIIARLPFGTVGNAIGECDDAFVIAAMEPDPSGDDCTVFAVTTPDRLSAADMTTALLDADINSNPLAVARHEGGAVHLIETDTLLVQDDARIARALTRLRAGSRATRLGFYARPIPDASLEGIVPA